MGVLEEPRNEILNKIQPLPAPFTYLSLFKNHEAFRNFANNFLNILMSR